MIQSAAIQRWHEQARNKKRSLVTRVMGVEFAHLKLPNRDDLYITEDGMPFLANLQPDCFWTDREWFKAHSTRLSGTSSVYRVRTKPVDGKDKEIVVKWNRMGQDIPGELEAERIINAEFNSPFEEISLVSDLRGETRRLPEMPMIQRPLAIYVPAETSDPERSGRREHRMRAKIQSHAEVALDMNRSYAVIYEWIEGIDAVEAFSKEIISREQMRELSLDAERKLARIGYVVHDNKPHHVIVRPKEDRTLAGDGSGGVLYALVDFELLERSPRRERKLRKARRAEYHQRQRDRFAAEAPDTLPPHLSRVKIMGVDYVYGPVESTRGRLWVVGKDPLLFDYFLPERWEKTPKTKISLYNEMYYTVTKDNIHLVWKVSKVGLQPDMDPFKADESRLLKHGYNSPFEEVALSIELPNRGVPCIYPRAIYMAGRDSSIYKDLFDESRYVSHREIRTPDGIPILRKKRDYVTIWGYWNGPDAKLADKDGDYYEGIDALRACKNRLISQRQYLGLLKATRSKLRKAGIEDLNLRGSHILISYNSGGKIIRDRDGATDIRICNFEFFRKVRPRQ